MRYTGTVIQWNSSLDYGIISTSELSSLLILAKKEDLNNIKKLKVGSKVEFEMQRTETGFKALDVTEV